MIKNTKRNSFKAFILIKKKGHNSQERFTTSEAVAEDHALIIDS